MPTKLPLLGSLTLCDVPRKARVLSLKKRTTFIIRLRIYLHVFICDCICFAACECFQPNSILIHATEDSFVYVLHLTHALELDHTIFSTQTYVSTHPNLITFRDIQIVYTENKITLLSTHSKLTSLYM